MVNKEISAAMKCLYNELVNEIDNHLTVKLGEDSEALAEAVKNAVKTTHNKFCEPKDKII